MPIFALLQQPAAGQTLGGNLAALLIVSCVAATAIALWRIFSIAGQPGWAAIVPVYNIVVLLRVAGRSGSWAFLLLVPIVNVVVPLVAALGVSRRFGHGVPLAIGLWLLPFVFYPMLAVTAEGPVARARATPV